jgi:xanthine dehydrogenase YagS FAD-binding subunit
MRPFEYVRASDIPRALDSAKMQGARYLAGGTTLVDLMRLEVMSPPRLVDINALGLDRIELHDGGLRVGAMVRNSDLARHPSVREHYPVLSEALLAGASPQLREMATVGGNLLQRTRCSYFRDGTWACNKREPGTGCSAVEGYSRMHAVLGGSASCIAAHPSDMCVALVALDATVYTRRTDGTERAIPIGELHTLPGPNPAVENVLSDGELITFVDLPASPSTRRSHYLKVRDRASYAFALASAAVVLDVTDGRIQSARVAMGGVGTKPWRSEAAERVLTGASPTDETFVRAGEVAMEGAISTPHNAFKVALGRRTVSRALRELGLA